MNLAFQVEKHMACHLERWPNADRSETKAGITRRLLSGQAWLWPEPIQLTLWNEKAVA